MDESLGKLAAMVNKVLPEIRLLNKTERDEEAGIVDDGLREWFRDRNRIDYRIYEYACRRLDGIKL